ncbi:MAG TPA: hypothetical protein VKR43_12950 [Bryobacteraceae bacterium]|jgi:hypothetical protein|nr:hypothetical protein [Bryobacteraceae bacterium]
MYNHRTTTKSISAKDGRVIAPRTKLDVLPWSGIVSEDGWRLAFVIDDRESIVTLSERDLNAYTRPIPA